MVSGAPSWSPANTLGGEGVGHPSRGGTPRIKGVKDGMFGWQTQGSVGSPPASADDSRDSGMHPGLRNKTSPICRGAPLGRAAGKRTGNVYQSPHRVPSSLATPEALAPHLPPTARPPAGPQGSWPRTSPLALRDILLPQPFSLPEGVSQSTLCERSLSRFPGPIPDPLNPGLGATPAHEV